MHAVVRARIVQNAEYHEAMAEHLQSLVPEDQSETKGDHLEELKTLAATHTEAARQLRAIVERDQPAAINRERAKQSIVRETGARRTLH